MISEKPTISIYATNFNKSKNSLNIFWKLDDEIRGSIFEFVIILKNSSNSCLYLIHLTCKNCEDTIIYQVYLSLIQFIYSIAIITFQIIIYLLKQFSFTHL